MLDPVFEVCMLAQLGISAFECWLSNNKYYAVFQVLDCFHVPVRLANEVSAYIVL